MKNRSRLSILFTIILIFFIFVLFAYFRFSNLGNRIAFGWDQERFSFQVRQLVVDHKPLLLGPRTSNERGFFLGPYFIYVLLPFYLVTNLHPIALALFLVIYNLAFFLGAYIILKRLFHQYIALLFLTFWSINPLIVHYDSVAWNPILVPIAVLIIWFLLKKIYDRNSRSMWLILGSSIGFFMHMHVQFAFIILFACAALFLMRKHSKPDAGRIILCILPILLSFVPLFIFDLRHDFLNLKAVGIFFAHRADNNGLNIFSWIPVFENVIQPISVVKSLFVALIFYCGFFAVEVFMLKDKKGFMKIFYGASIIVWIMFPFVFAKYGQRPSEYYFLFLYPFIYTGISDFAYSLKKIPMLASILVVLFIVNLRMLQLNLTTDYYSLKYKDELVRKLVQRLKGKIFNLSYTTILTTDYGFRYLVDYYQLKPTGNWSDPLVQIQIPADNTSSIRVANMGVIIPKELSY